MKYTIISVLLAITLVSSCSKKSSTEPGDHASESVIISGSIGDNASHISHVGLFNINPIEWNKPIIRDNSSPVVVAPITGNQWTLSISDISQGNILDYLPNSGNVYMFALFGWPDIDGDGSYDPLSGENPAFSHINQDTLSDIMLFYNGDFKKEPIDRWSLRILGPLNDYKDSWFLVDDSQAGPLTYWIVRDSTFSFLSGYAHVIGTTPPGIRIILQGSDIDTTNSDDRSSRIRLTLPAITARVYTGSEVNTTISYSFGAGGGSVFGNLGRAGLTFVDTVVQKRILGWVALEMLDGFKPGETTVRIYGSFDVPIDP